MLDVSSNMDRSPLLPLQHTPAAALTSSPGLHSPMSAAAMPS
jgi:hypothetical protein